MKQRTIQEKNTHTPASFSLFAEGKEAYKVVVRGSMFFTDNLTFSLSVRKQWDVSALELFNSLVKDW